VLSDRRSTARTCSPAALRFKIDAELMIGDMPIHERQAVVER